VESGTSDFRLKAVGFQTVRKYDETEERSQNPEARHPASLSATQDTEGRRLKERHFELSISNFSE
jgi:hypothetical protein